MTSSIYIHASNRAPLDKHFLIKKPKLQIARITGFPFICSRTFLKSPSRMFNRAVLEIQSPTAFPNVRPSCFRNSVTAGKDNKVSLRPRRVEKIHDIPLPSFFTSS